MLLVYTGKAHHSGINNWEVIKSVIEGDPKPLAALKQIAELSLKMAKAIQGGNWSEIPALFEQETQARIELSPGFSSPEIEKLSRRSVCFWYAGMVSRGGSKGS